MNNHIPDNDINFIKDNYPFTASVIGESSIQDKLSQNTHLLSEGGRLFEEIKEEFGITSILHGVTVLSTSKLFKDHLSGPEIKGFSIMLICMGYEMGKTGLKYEEILAGAFLSLLVTTDLTLLNLETLSTEPIKCLDAVQTVIRFGMTLKVISEKSKETGSNSSAFSDFVDGLDLDL